MSFCIGKNELKYGLVLAPMAGTTDSSFRSICRKAGAEYTVTEMLSAKALCYEQLCRKEGKYAVKTASIAGITDSESPCAIQIFGAEPEYMAHAAALLENGEYRGADDGRCLPCAIDINMGCPVHKVVSNGEGSALMKNPVLIGEIVKAVKNAVGLPVTVKIRAGWDCEHINAPEVAKIAEANGADAVCVHARTRTQFYSPGVDLSVIERVKNAVKIPVIGNGDIFCADDALNMMDKTGCDGVAIARGSFGNPWIFTEIRAKIEGKEYTPPTTAERLDTAWRHACDMIEKKGERIGFVEARPQLAHYTRDIRCSAVARHEIMNASGMNEIKTIFEKLLDGGYEE